MICKRKCGGGEAGCQIAQSSGVPFSCAWRNGCTGGKIISSNADSSVLIPVRSLGGKLDGDDPTYSAGAPDIYLTLGIAYDSLAAPGVQLGSDNVRQPDLFHMQPRLASGWAEQANGDWIVTLRPDVKSQHGNTLTAEQVVWSFDKVRSHNGFAWWRWNQVVGVEDVRVEDQLRVRYRMRVPNPTFPNWLLSMTPNVVDAVAVRDHATPDDPWGTGWLNRHVAGYGAYDVAGIEPDSMLFQRRTDSWMGKPEAERIEVRQWTDRSTLLSLLDEKRPVLLAGVEPDDAAAMQGRDDVTAIRTWAGHLTIEMDFKKPPFNDPRVRHALAHATPTARIIADGLRGYGRPWHSPLKGCSQGYNPSHWHYDLDMAKARRMLKEAGWGDGFESEIYFLQRADTRRIAEIVAEAWRELGIELTFKNLATTPVGWAPPLHLRIDCSHNLSDPLLDIAHDYAPMSPIAAKPGREDRYWNLRFNNDPTRWVHNNDAIAAFAALLAERDRGQRARRMDALQAQLVEFGSSIFIAEGQFISLHNRHVPASLLAPDSRLYQALHFQNAAAHIYLPPRQF